MTNHAPHLDPASAARPWLGAAVSSLVCAGALAALLVAGRAPGLDRLAWDPAFFRRCLVLHVDLALVAWLLAFLAALWCCLPASPGAARRARAGAFVSMGGLGILALSILPRGAEPVLSNYIPAIDHPLFAAGLCVFAAGLALALLDGRLIGAAAGRPLLHLPEASAIFLRGAAVAVLLAIMTFGASALTLPEGLVPLARWEALAWGGGHVLQFASVAAMLACWQALVERAGAEPLSPRVARVLCMALTAPLLLAPVLALRNDGGRHAFTRLMEAGIAPVVLVAIGMHVVALVRRREREGGAFAAAFAASAGLTLIGFALGFAIDGSSTVVPAHYHAAIGGVTASFMAMTPLLLPSLGFSPLGRRARAVMRWQPVAFAGGQALFAAGFALAGAHGMARKVYAAEQARTGIETAGLGVMAAGGVVAVVAGLAFLVIVGSALSRRSFARAKPRLGDSPAGVAFPRHRA